MRTPTLIVAAIAAGMTVTATAHDEEQIEETHGSRVSFDAGLDITSEYFFRGYLQEDQGFISQPWAEASFNLRDSDDWSLDATLGIWNSFHSEHTASNGTGQESWYEADWYGALTACFDSFEVGAAYSIYTYPNNTAFDSVHEVALFAGFDLPDDGIGQWLGDLSLLLAIEVDNSNVSTDEATYFEIGFGPSFDILDGDATLSIPVTLGFSLDDYYVSGGEDDDFGWAAIGAVIDYPLCSGDYGDWTLTGGIDVLLLGDAAEASNNGDDSAVVGFIGISMSY